MAASYTAMEYLGVPLAGALGTVTLVLILTICLIRKVGAKAKSPFLPFAFLAIPIIACILLGSWLIPVFNQLGDLLIPGEYAVSTTAGRIDTVTQADVKVYHLRNGRFCTGQEISMDDASYYVISEGLLSEGMYIEMQYARFENNVILSWQEVTPERAEQIRTESPLSDTETPVAESQKEVSAEARLIGAWMFRIGFLSFLAIAVLNTVFAQKIRLHLLKQDALVKGEIKPNKSALLCSLLPLVCLSLIILGMVVGSAEYRALVVLVVGVCALSTIMGADATTVLRMEGSTFAVRRFGKEKTYQMHDVRAVFWKKSRGWIGKTMVLVLNDGRSYWFNMDVFSGVENMYKSMNQYLEYA